MPFAVYESNDNKLEIISSKASLQGKPDGLIFGCTDYAIKKKSVVFTIEFTPPFLEISAHFDSLIISQSLISMGYAGIKPVFLVQGSKKTPCEVYKTTDIWIYSSHNTEKNIDGWVCSLLGFSQFAEVLENESPITIKSPHILQDGREKVYMLNNFSKSWINKNMEIAGLWLDHDIINPFFNDKIPESFPEL